VYDAVSAARDLPVAVVLPAGDATRAAFPDAEQIPVAPDTQVTLAQLGAGPVQLQRLTDEQYRQYVHALDVADQPAQPATGAWQLAEDHGHAATMPRPGPHPLLLHHGENSAGTDPGSPFPALLATSTPIRLVKATADVSDGAGGVPAPIAAAAGQDPEPTPGGSGEEVPLDEQAPGGEVVGEGDPDAPQIYVLGPIRVTGITGSGHGPKVRALAALIYLRPGRSAESLCTAMDPVSPWSTRTLQSRLSEIRSRFGAAADGEPFLPRPKDGGYTFHAGLRSDWETFQRLATRGLAAGPEAGIPDLEDALGLVRGRPFESGDFPWADSVQHEIVSRIVDVAHTLAAWHTDGDTPDLDAARHAALRGLDIDETAEVLYRDWMTIEWAAENTSGIRKAVARVQQVARSYDISLDTITEQTIDLVTSPDRSEPAHAGQAY